MSLSCELARGLEKLGLAVPAETQQRLLGYVALLEKWNKVYNLTALRSARDMIGRHLLDSLAVLPHVVARSILDVGSGAGLPGIPLALALPQARVTLLEANQKKASFLQQAVIELAIANARVVCERVEGWRPRERFQLIISRAFSSLTEFVLAARPLCAPHGTLAAMKGKHPKEELEQLPQGYRVTRVVPLSVPGVVAARHLVLISAD